MDINKIKDMNDTQLVSVYKYYLELEQKRNEASVNEKFTQDRIINRIRIKKMDFAPANPAFLELKNEMLNEIFKRKLEI